jgi:hypothetical protein
MNFNSLNRRLHTRFQDYIKSNQTEIIDREARIAALVDANLYWSIVWRPLKTQKGRLKNDNDATGSGRSVWNCFGSHVFDQIF